MNGPIRFTGVDGEHYYINPSVITLFTKSTPDMCKLLAGSRDMCVRGASIVIVNSLPLQVEESETDILQALKRYRQKTEDDMIRLRDKIQREDWKDGYDDTEE